MAIEIRLLPVVGIVVLAAGIAAQFVLVALRNEELERMSGSAVEWQQHNAVQLLQHFPDTVKVIYGHVLILKLFSVVVPYVASRLILKRRLPTWADCD